MKVELIIDPSACRDGRRAYNIFAAGVKVGRWVESDRGFVSVRWFINGIGGTDLNAGRLFADDSKARKYAEGEAAAVVSIKKKGV